ncbi:acyloxyacyl hydrolase [Alteromonadaceae bacterium M269]|nr:acyloxyacyl hydrolase [Alteromonadaceae bacterium M269]
MKNLAIALAFLFVSLFSVTSQAHQAVAVDYLIGESDVSGFRLAYRPYEGEFKKFKWLGTLDVYWEVSFNVWEFSDTNRTETDFAIAISPVFSKQFTTLWGRPLKWEAGIGISLVDDTEFAGKDIGSHYQFEDRLGLTLVLDKEGKQSASIRYFHYSNGGLDSNNPGLDFLNLSYVYRF